MLLKDRRDSPLGAPASSSTPSSAVQSQWLVNNAHHIFRYLNQAAADSLPFTSHVSAHKVCHGVQVNIYAFIGRYNQACAWELCVCLDLCGNV